MRKNKVQKLIYGEGDAGAKPPETKPEQKFTQADLDEQVKKRLGEANKKFDAERAGFLEKQKALETDSAAKAELEKQLEELNNRYKSKEELAADALKKERAEAEGKLKQAATERDSWKKRYEDQTLLTELTAAASKKAKVGDKDVEVHNPSQLVKFLKPDARVTQKVVDGKPTDQLETRVKVTVKGKELDLTPEEAVKSMAEDPEYGNFFKSGVVGGLGASGGKQGNGGDGLLSMPQNEFTKRFLEGTLPKRT